MDVWQDVSGLDVAKDGCESCKVRFGLTGGGIGRPTGVCLEHSVGARAIVGKALRHDS